MNTVILKPNGDILADHTSGRVDPLVYLSHGVELESSYTLRSFFRMIEAYPLLARLNTFFPGQLEQFQACPPENCDFGEYDTLEFSKTVEMVGFPGEPKLEIYNSLKGISGSEAMEIRSSRLEGLLDVSLRLGKLRHVVFGDRVDVFEFETVFSLFELIDGIAWELSFHGTPEACEIRR